MRLLTQLKRNKYVLILFFAFVLVVAFNPHVLAVDCSDYSGPSCRPIFNRNNRTANYWLANSVHWLRGSLDLLFIYPMIWVTVLVRKILG